jgi:CheY-like chemotaxis protein
MMEVQCPRCRARYQVDERELSQEILRFQCPACACLFKEIRKPNKSLDGKPPEPVPADSFTAPFPVLKNIAEGSCIPKKILVVDDSTLFRGMIVDILQPLQADFLVASNGIEAVHIIKAHKPDVVLLDLNLPQKTGYEVIREIRSCASLEDTCLLAMSGVYHKEVDAAEAINAGANDFIKKSFTPEKLRQFVKTWLIW